MRKAAKHSLCLRMLMQQPRAQHLIPFARQATSGHVMFQVRLAYSMKQLSLSTSQHFEIERFSREIDQTEDIDSLQKLAKTLLRAWIQQKAVTNWAISESTQNLGSK